MEYAFVFISRPKGFFLREAAKESSHLKTVRSCCIDLTDAHLIKKILSFPTVRLLSEMGKITELPGQRLREFITKTNGKKGELRKSLSGLTGLGRANILFWRLHTSCSVQEIKTAWSA